MLPPNPGDWAHVRIYLMSLVETIAIALLGTLGAADHRPADRAARRPQRGRGTRDPLPGPPLARYHPQRRRPDLGADLDQRGGPRAVRGRAGDHDLRHRQFRQAVLRGDRGGRPQAARGHRRVGRRRCCSASASASCPRCSRCWRARCSTSSNPTPARRPSSASSARAASACTSPRRSARSSCSRPRSSSC